MLLCDWTISRTFGLGSAWPQHKASKVDTWLQIPDITSIVWQSIKTKRLMYRDDDTSGDTISFVVERSVLWFIHLQDGKKPTTALKWSTGFFLIESVLDVVERHCLHLREFNVSVKKHAQQAFHMMRESNWCLLFFSNMDSHGIHILGWATQQKVIQHLKLIWRELLLL